MRILILFILSLSLSSNFCAQTNCSNGVTLIPGVQHCGDSTGNTGDFPSDGSAPANPCNASYNDDEYWLTYSPDGEVDEVELTLSSISTFFTGLFVFDDCPSGHQPV